ncbi:O-antigen ligase family protein [Prochlorococcus sp. AH-716-P20]|nr:O-antigen ligase family protein [Prochlorococcus sp. AH-716-P20]
MKGINLLNIGQKLFNLGITFLISVPSIAALLLLLSSIISFIEKRYLLFKNIWNYPIFLSFGIILLSTFRNGILSKQEIINHKELWLGLFNWLPLLILFIFIPPYIKTKSQKILFSKLIILSNFPLILSCFLQKSLGIYGPLSLLNGLIVWYQRMPGETTISTTGLFNNPNYTGFSLAISLPFIIFNIINIRKNKFAKTGLIIYLLITIYYIFSSNSRNALFSTFLIFILAFGVKSIIIITFILIAILPINIILSSLFEIDSLLIYLKQFFDEFYSSFSSFKIENIFSSQRFEIWSKSIKMILEKPLLGWGAGTFGMLYLLYGGIYGTQHSHNIILQITQSYGLPFSIIICTTIVLLILNAYKKILKNKEPNISINYFWLISVMVASIHQLFDIVLFEGRLNIIYCILLTGSKTMIINNE